MWRERYDFPKRYDYDFCLWAGPECPGMIGPLDTATLARRPIIPFLGRERYDSWISEQNCLPMDRALRYEIRGDYGA